MSDEEELNRRAFETFFATILTERYCQLRVQGLTETRAVYVAARDCYRFVDSWWGDQGEEDILSAASSWLHLEGKLVIGETEG